MARIRTIKPKFWDDRKLSKVSRDARLLFIAIWNFCDDNGVIIAEPIWLKSKIFPYDQIQLQVFEKWLNELKQFGFISLFLYLNEEFYYLPNFIKHQVINRPNIEDVFVPKSELSACLERSLINHGNINDESLPERKGEERKGKETIVDTEFATFTKWVETNAPTVAKLQKPFSEAAYNKLKVQYTPEQIKEIILKMYNWKKLTTTKVDAYLTFLTFAKDYPKINVPVQKEMQY